MNEVMRIAFWVILSKFVREADSMVALFTDTETISHPPNPSSKMQFALPNNG
jgi:hypothetical protein